MDVNQEAIELLIANIGNLPHHEYGVINLLPWAVDSDQTNALKRQVCEAIVGVFADAGYPMSREMSSAPAAATRDVTVSCRMCSATLASFAVSDGGVANVPAAAVISAMSKLNPECPHGVLTADDHRRAIEQAVLAQQANEGN